MGAVVDWYMRRCATLRSELHIIILRSYQILDVKKCSALGGWPCKAQFWTTDDIVLKVSRTYANFFEKYDGTIWFLMEDVLLMPPGWLLNTSPSLESTPSLLMDLVLAQSSASIKMGENAYTGRGYCSFNNSPGSKVCKFRYFTRIYDDDDMKCVINLHALFPVAFWRYSLGTDLRKINTEMQAYRSICLFGKV